MILKYRSGEEIKKGDHILFHQNKAEIELVATDPDIPEQAWHVQQFGSGVQILDPYVSGRTFIRAESIPEYEDIRFVSRAEEK